MKVLVIGSGGREHALAWKLSKSSKVSEVYCAPGNPGTANCAKNVSIGTSELESLRDFALQNSIELTVVGPEAPLAAGVVDIFEAAGLKVFGPNQEASRLESSKAFAKEIMIEAGVPTAESKEFQDYRLALEYLELKKFPIVIKADGLAAGKGVTVAANYREAESALAACLLDKKHGEAGSSVLIEDFLEGLEASVIALVSGEDVLPFFAASDYKRLEERNLGPNTGGMGVVSPTPVLEDSRLAEVREQVFKPVLKVLKKRGINYRGFLYAGLMIREDGSLNVLEFNCRFGDPEAQAILVRLEDDLLGLIQSCFDGTLKNKSLRAVKDTSICIVASSAGYPGRVDDGKELKLPSPEVLNEENSILFLAGAKYKEGSEPATLLTKGGRVLSVVSLGENMTVARESALEVMSQVNFEGKQFRKDIGNFY